MRSQSSEGGLQFAGPLLPLLISIPQILQAKQAVREELLELFDIMSAALQPLRDVDQFVSIPQFREAMSRVENIMKEAVAFAEDWANPQKSVGRSTFMRSISYCVLTNVGVTIEVIGNFSVEDEATVARLKKKFDVYIDQFDRGVDIQTLLNTETTKNQIQLLGTCPETLGYCIPDLYDT